MQKFMGKLCFQEMHSFQTKNFIRQVVSLKKYEIVKDNFKEVDGVKVYQIRALKDFQNDLLKNKEIKKGDLGGYIESEKICHKKEIAGLLTMLLFAIMLQLKIIL